MLIVLLSSFICYVLRLGFMRNENKVYCTTEEINSPSDIHREVVYLSRYSD
jgi:hypothetical protein